MSCTDYVQGRTSVTECGIFPARTNLGDPRTADSEYVVVSTESIAKVPPPLCVTGVVDAILEVGSQRKALLNQIRSALLAGEDADAIRLARQLCGLPE
jgi:hypothetical protein